MTQKEREVLYRCGLFSGIAPEDAERLLGCLHMEEAHFDRNQMIWNIGDPVRACAVVLSGSLRAGSVSASGQHSLMARHHPGSLVGDVLMVTPGGTSPVYVAAVEPVTLVFLPFRGIMDGCPQCCPCHARLRENLISEIAQKFWAQRQKLKYLSENSLRRRIVLYLLDHAQSGSTFSLGITREELADYLCVNRSALSRELSRMRAEGLLDYYRDTFRVDVDKLRELG